MGISKGIKEVVVEEEEELGIENEEKLFKCDKCGENFIFKGSLYKEFITGEDDIDYLEIKIRDENYSDIPCIICEHCGKEMSKQSLYDQDRKVFKKKIATSLAIALRELSEINIYCYSLLVDYVDADPGYCEEVSFKILDGINAYLKIAEDKSSKEFQKIWEDAKKEHFDSEAL